MTNHPSRSDDRIAPADDVAALMDAAAERSALALYSINALADMVIWVDQDGRYVFVNEAATRLLGYSEEEFSRLRVCDVDPDVDEAFWYRHWEELKRVGVIKIESTNTNKQGQAVPIEITAHYVRFGGREYNCAIVRDISERKMTQARMEALHEEIYRLSITDGLTGISNRRHFDGSLAKEIERLEASGEPLSLILLDVDHFKSFNDHQGHMAGDACLRRVAGVIDGAMRQPIDLAARYGGEEFVCILPSTTLVEALEIAETIRARIAALGLAHDLSPEWGIVTASLGVVSTEGNERETAQSLLARADALLYRAKEAGRNRVEAGATPRA
ncbi:GGDEF domain-containing protein [Aureimonas ureilytica]|uniref:GGDEF domain-containing protein n=1 Tax=Aureimonas ureilytica TaxID=401562 RepID=UPI00192CF8B0|nr:GGDEF domain-containing protein [Aureimonas ureilytica]